MHATCSAHLILPDLIFLIPDNHINHETPHYEIFSSLLLLLPL